MIKELWRQVARGKRWEQKIVDASELMERNEE